MNCLEKRERDLSLSNAWNCHLISVHFINTKKGFAVMIY